MSPGKSMQGPGLFETCPNHTHESSNALGYLANADTGIVLQQASGQRLGDAVEHGCSLIGRSLAQLLRGELGVLGVIRMGPHARYRRPAHLALPRSGNRSR